MPCFSFKLLLSRIHIFIQKVPIVEKKPLPLAFPYLGTISLQIMTRLQKPMKGLFNYCKLQVFFKGKKKLCSGFCLKEPFTQTLTSFIMDYAMNPIMENVLDDILL